MPPSRNTAKRQKLLLIDFRAQRPTKDFLKTKFDSLTSIAPLLPTLLEPGPPTAHVAFIEQLYTAHQTSPLNWAASLMLHQICRGLLTKNSVSSIVDALTPPPNLPEQINPKWWWLLAQSIKIVGEYSSKPALELLNKTFSQATPYKEDSLDHPLWAIAFFLHQASKKHGFARLRTHPRHIYDAWRKEPAWDAHVALQPRAVPSTVA